MAQTATEPNNDILYEILVLSEWIEDYDSVISKKTLSTPISDPYFYLNPWRLFTKPKVNNFKYLETEYPWHLAVSEDGKVIAVLQETLLEIKTAKDEYFSVVGKACVPQDQFPKLRKLSWSPDNSFLAVSRDNGTVIIYNLFACNIATIEPGGNTSEVVNPVVSLCFLHSKFVNTKWSNELLIVYQKGTIRSILLSHLEDYDYEENIKFSMETYYCQGISSAVCSSNNLLYVAGPCSQNEHGITAWRILNDYPYLKPALDSENKFIGSRSFLKFISGFFHQRTLKTILKMKVSPNQKLLACLYLSGEISLWRLPQITLQKKWVLQEQPQYNKCNPQNTEKIPNESDFYPVDISWWSDTALVISRQNGAITVCSITTLDNLLGESPEFVARSPQISSVFGEKSAVIALECETENSYNSRFENDEEKEKEVSFIQATIQAALYFFTDIERFEPKRKPLKVIQKTYRLLALKKTSPEELYSRKIDNEEYEEALSLARKFNLDCDLVYQKRWRNNPVSEESINNYLNKVNKLLWVVKECVERVPEAINDAKFLLEFGLKKTDLVNRSVNGLNEEEMQLITYRRKLLQFLDNLAIFEKIIGSPDKYKSYEYNNFRKKSAYAATIDFARKENWLAVSIMFTYSGPKVLPYWLLVLSNFPETLKPLNYRTLLPEIVGDNQVFPWETKKLRNLDWCEENEFRSSSEEEQAGEEEIFCDQDPALKEFFVDALTAEKVEKWYKNRVYEIEKRSGLIENALCFVVLAKERGVKVLDELHDNLLTLEACVYLVGIDNVTLSKLETLHHLDQCKLLLSKTRKSTFMDDLKNLIVPLSKRCKKRNCHDSYVLVKNILLEFSQESLELPLELLNYLKKGFSNPFPLSLIQTATIALDCIYSCPKETQLENCFLIFECLPQRDDSKNEEEKLVHDQIDKLEVHLEVCEILERYNTRRSVKFIKENENKEAVGKELMEQMADYTKRESLDFTELLSDLCFIQSKIFSSITVQFCYELCALSQMLCECEEIIESAEDILQCKKGEKEKMVPFEKSVELVLKAGKSHFDRANGFNDPSIKLAETCLKLIGEPQAQVCEELDLIEAVQLLGDFDVNTLPLQVRKPESRMKLLESCIQKNSKNYKAWQRLLQLAQTLRLFGDDRGKREGEVLKLIAQHAFNCQDYEYCSEICNRLISRNFGLAWTVIRLLALSPDFENKTTKKLLFAFTLLHCPEENLEELLVGRVALNNRHFEVEAS